MITFLRLGTKGNLGNQLFQIASTIGISAKNNHPFAFPSWQYSNYFDIPLPTLDQDLKFKTLTEKQFDFHEWPIGTDNYNLEGWLQSEKYFDSSKTRYYLKFKPDLIQKLREEYRDLLSEDNILISVRRGDFVNHPRYFQLDYTYYLLALIYNFPDWKRRKLVFTSDDINYCRRHFGFLPNVNFIEDLSPIEQLVLGSQFHHFIISNSTFSWWIAWLGEKKTSEIVRPKQNFRDQYRLKNNDKDYFPERWIRFDHNKYKLPKEFYKVFIQGEVEKLQVNLKFEFQKIKKHIKRMTLRVGGKILFLN